MRATPLPVSAPSCAAFSLLQLRFQLRQLAILDLRGTIELPFARLLFGFEAQRLNLLLQLADAGDRLALLRPARTQSRGSSPSCRQAPVSTSCSARGCSRRSRASVRHVRFRVKSSRAPAGRSPSAHCRSESPAKPPLHPPGRSPCRAETGRGYSDATSVAAATIAESLMRTLWCAS